VFEHLHGLAVSYREDDDLVLVAIKHGDQLRHVQPHRRIKDVARDEANSQTPRTDLHKRGTAG